MSKFEAELRLPCKQPYAYISVWIRGESVGEMADAVNDFLASGLNNDLANAHTESYDVVMGTKKPAPNAQALIESELGGKVISEEELAAGYDKLAASQKPWERPKPATKADPNDPFASFK